MQHARHTVIRCMCSRYSDCIPPAVLPVRQLLLPQRRRWSSRTLLILQADRQSLHILVTILVLSPFTIRCSSMLPIANCLITLQVAQWESCSMSPLQICHKLQ